MADAQRTLMLLFFALSGCVQAAEEGVAETLEWPTAAAASGSSASGSGASGTSGSGATTGEVGTGVASTSGRLTTSGSLTSSGGGLTSGSGGTGGSTGVTPQGASGGASTGGTTTGGTVLDGGHSDPCDPLDFDLNAACRGAPGFVVGCECPSSPWVLTCLPDPFLDGGEVGGVAANCGPGTCTALGFQSCGDDPTCSAALGRAGSPGSLGCNPT